MDATIIDQWISEIESNAVYLKDKKAENLINLWKFSSSYSPDAEITKDGLMNTAEQCGIKVNFMDVCLTDAPKSNVLKSICDDLTPALREDANYYMVLHEQQNNFTSERLLHLKQEMLDALQGRLIPYSYVKKMAKVTAPAKTIYTNMTLKDCTRDDINSTIQQAGNLKLSGFGKWLVVVLDRLAGHCDSFYISDDVLKLPFTTNYEKLFLFDFYTGEITELPVA